MGALDDDAVRIRVRMPRRLAFALFPATAMPLIWFISLTWTREERLGGGEGHLGRTLPLLDGLLGTYGAALVLLTAVHTVWWRRSWIAWRHGRYSAGDHSGRSRRPISPLAPLLGAVDAAAWSFMGFLGGPIAGLYDEVGTPLGDAVKTALDAKILLAVISLIILAVLAGITLLLGAIVVAVVTCRADARPSLWHRPGTVRVVSAIAGTGSLAVLAVPLKSGYDAIYQRAWEASPAVRLVLPVVSLSALAVAVTAGWWADHTVGRGQAASPYQISS